MSTEVCQSTKPDSARRQLWRPLRADITETKGEFVLKADLPGVGKEQLEITLDGDQLTLIGRRDTSQAPGRRVAQESAPGDFRRSFQLDAEINRDAIKATIQNGVLTLTLPKPEAARPRQIQVQ